MVEEAKEPYTFAEAVQDKYTATYEPKLFNNILLSPKRRAALLNQQCHKQKSILALDGCKIGSAGEDGKISEMCPNVVELDISSNLLHSWEQKTVFEIKQVESRRPPVKEISLRFWVPHTADLYVLEGLKAEIFVFERQKSAVRGWLKGHNFSRVKNGGYYLPKQVKTLQKFEVFLVIRQLPKLTFLNLSCNPLETVLDDEKIDVIIGDSELPNLKTMILNNTRLPFEVVFKLLDMFPGIEELHLSLNSYGHVTDWPSSFPNVRKLHFNNNGLEEWNDVVRIGKLFPNLKSLILCENCIKEVKVDVEAKAFENLITLSLSQTEVDDWNSLDEMRKLPVLEDLRLVGIPLGRREDSSKARQLFISRLPNVKKLNGSTIDCNEREDAERFFIRHYMDSDEPPVRYHELVAIHGQIDRLAEVDMSIKEFAQVTLYLDEEEYTKIVIDLSTTIRELKRIIGRKIGLAPKSFRMFHFDKYIAVELNTLSKHLYLYYIKDGDEIWAQSLLK